jgi:glucose-1-phosphate thymidylyltransferase
MTNQQQVRKGIILAGGSGSRLHPLTRAVSKQLLPIYDKPMVYYPLSILMEAEIRDILIISTPADIGGFERLFGDGSQLGLRVEFAVQPRPEGLAQAFIIGRNFLGDDYCALILGDNLLYGPALASRLKSLASPSDGATIFAYHVDDARPFGVVEFDEHGRATSLHEKPTEPKSAYAVPGLYFYDNQAVDLAASLRPSPRGELEITDLNRAYLDLGQLRVERLETDVTWLDAGTAESLFLASQFVQSTEAKQGQKVGCIEEIAFREGFIGTDQLERLANSMNNTYGQYLLELSRNECDRRLRIVA